MSKKLRAVPPTGTALFVLKITYIHYIKLQSSSAYAVSMVFL